MKYTVIYQTLFSKRCGKSGTHRNYNCASHVTNHVPMAVVSAIWKAVLNPCPMSWRWTPARRWPQLLLVAVPLVLYLGEPSRAKWHFTISSQWNSWKFKVIVSWWKTHKVGGCLLIAVLIRTKIHWVVFECLFYKPCLRVVHTDALGLALLYIFCSVWCCIAFRAQETTTFLDLCGVFLYLYIWYLKYIHTIYLHMYIYMYVHVFFT